MEYQGENLANPSQIGCRICLEQEPRKSLIGPCLCRGSTQYIHEHCLIEWSTKNSKHKYNPMTQQFQLQCQICKFQIPLDYQQQHQLRTCRKLIDAIKEEKFKFIIQIISIVCMAFCFMFMLRKHFDYVMMREMFLVYMTLGLAVFMALSVIVLIGTMMYSYGVEIIQIFKVKRLSNLPHETGSAIAMKIQPPINSDQLTN